VSSGWPEAASDANAERLARQVDREIITMVHTNIDDRSRKMTGSIGEGMVDLTAVNTDHRAHGIKRAGANLIDLIEQLGVPPGDAGPQRKQQAMEHVVIAVRAAIEAAEMRSEQPPAQAPVDYTHEHPEGAAV